MSFYAEIKNLLKHGSVYTVGIVISKIVSFLLLPIYTNYLEPAEYGIAELVGLTIDVISTAIGIGMTAAVMRFYFKYEDEESRNRVVSSALIGVMTIMGTTSLICLLLSEQISLLVFSSTEQTIYFRIMFVTMFLTSGIQIPLIFLRAKLKSVTYVLINLVKLVIQLSLNIYFLVFLGTGVVGVFYSGLVSSIVLAVYLVITTFREVGFRFSWPIYKELLRFGAPLIIADMSIFTLTYADHYMLNYLGDLTVVGIYSLAYKFGMLVSILFVYPFNLIWNTRMFEIAKEDYAKEMYRKVLVYCAMGAMTISLGLSIFTRDVLKVMADQAYWSAYKVVPLVTTSYVLTGMIPVAGAGMMIMNKTKYFAISTSTAMVINLILNFIMIPIWGAMGAALATLLSFMVRLGIDTYNSQKLFPVDHDWGRLIRMTVMYVALLLLARIIIFDNLVASLAANTALFLAFPTSLFLMGVVQDDEKEFLRTRLAKLFHKH